MSRSSPPHLPAPRTSLQRLGLLLLAVTVPIVAVLTLWFWQPWSAAGGLAPDERAASQAGALISPELPAPRQAGNNWSVAVGPDFNPASDIAVLAWDTPEPALEFVNPRTGQITARVRVGNSARAVFRRSAGQLLVSDEAPLSPNTGSATGSVSPGTRLLIFDLRNGLNLQAELPLPNRLRSAGYGQAIVLSGDETRLAYIEHEYTGPAGGCSGQDSSGCDRFRLVTVDLRTDPAIAGAVDLPGGCYPVVTPAGAQGFAVRCSDTTATVFGPDLGVQQQVSFAASITAGQDYHEPAIRSFKAGLLAGLVLTSGQVVGLTSDGVALRGQQRTRLLPENTWLAGQPVALGGDRYALPFTTVRNLPQVDGVVFANLATARAERTTRFPAATGALPRPNGEVLLIRQGALRQSSSAGIERQVADIRDDADVLIP